MRERPIGIFDSGIGGLTALKEISRIMPNEDIIYFGDTSRVPYGDKNIETIRLYAKQDFSFLMCKSVKLIVAACGTVSSLPDFSCLNPGVPAKGVVQPACIAAVKATKNKRIGVIGTNSTVRSNSYKNQIYSLMPEALVYQKACPMFVPIIESGDIKSHKEDLIKYATEYLAAFNSLGIDTLILGCTHYRIIKDVIKAALAEDIKLIDPGKEVASSVFELIKNKDIFTKKHLPGRVEIFISGEKGKFVRIANSFLGIDVEKNVKTIDINKWS